MRFSNKVMGPHAIFPQTVGFFGILFRICHADIKCVCDDNRCSDDNQQLTLLIFEIQASHDLFNESCVVHVDGHNH